MELQLEFTQRSSANINTLESQLKDIFRVLQTGINTAATTNQGQKQISAGVIDLTQLKYYLHKANMHIDNPPMFKTINDLAKSTDYEGCWDEQQFVGFFMNHDQLSDRQPPKIDQIVAIFELLDREKQGKITASSMFYFLKLLQQMN